MTPIYGRSICHGSVTAAVTSRDKMLFSNLQVSRPFTLDVTVLSLIYSVKMALSRPSRRNGCLARKRNMLVKALKTGNTYIFPFPPGKRRDSRDSGDFAKRPRPYMGV